VPPLPWISSWDAGQLPGAASGRPYEEKAKGKRKSEGESDGPRLKPSLLAGVFRWTKVLQLLLLKSGGCYLKKLDLSPAAPRRVPLTNYYFSDILSVGGWVHYTPGLGLGVGRVRVGGVGQTAKLNATPGRS